MYANNIIYHFFVNGKCQTDRRERVSRVWVTFRLLDVRGRDTYINAFEHDIISSKPSKIEDYFSKEECTALTNLRKSSDIVNKPADKDSGTVIMDYSWYINECYCQRNDPNYYQKQSTNLTSKMQERVKEYLNRLTKMI